MQRNVWPAILCLALLALAGCRHGGQAPATASPLPQAKVSASAAPAPAVPPQPEPLPPGGVKGIYLTGWTAGVKKHFANLVSLVDRTELNAMVIDVKDDGEVAYDADVPLVKKAHASRKMYRIDKLMAVLKAHHIFPIARIACFRDTPLAEARPDLAVQDAGGHVWHDRSHHAWLNPYQKACWDYNVDLALDAIKHGFKEIQFDYVRFPSEGNLSALHYPGKPPNSKREDQIVAFLKYAREKIKAKGAWFSADVFGLTSLVKDDEGIGQKFVKVVGQLDYLCPMVYPSHYHLGEYGIPNPNKEPYKIIKLSLGDAKKRLQVAPNCKLRPWLQDFSLYGVHYGPNQVKAEIKAARELGIKEFLLWNAGCKYTEAALAKEAPPQIARASAPAPAPAARPAAPATPH
ncbi:MAG TPA: putative glycoside hydrolase [Chthonomonadaceae bacterium]|nr:putative glycoside hydrolase [Chthonomonadaceae bacterium]